MHSVKDALGLILGAVEPCVYSSQEPSSDSSQAPSADSSQAPSTKKPEQAITAGGRHIPVLGEVLAETPLPPFNRVAMDGIAICLEAVGHDQPAADGRRHFTREALQPAGAEPLRLQDPVRGCIEVMTGAVLPHGCDTVINYERLEPTDTGFLYRQGDDLNELAIGANVHHQGSDYPQGHRLISDGALATAPVMGLLASMGMLTYPAPYRPRIAIVATGDELVKVSEQPLPHQIRMSNTSAIARLLRSYGFDDLHDYHLPDKPEAVEAFFLANSYAEKPADMVIFSGGVSKGKKDYIPAVVAGSFGDILVHGVSQRPGKPLLFAAMKPQFTGCRYLFGLPGNPVSALVCALRYVVPALRKLTGTDRWPGLWGAPVVLAEDFRFAKALTRFAPVTLTVGADARLMATPIAIGGSGDYASLAASDGFIELPAKPEHFAAGGVYPYYGWLALPLCRRNDIRGSAAAQARAAGAEGTRCQG